MNRFIKLTLFSILCLLPVSVRADVAGDKKKALIAGVKQIAVAPIFFSSATLFKAQEQKPSGVPESSGKKRPQSEMDRYREQLRFLQEDAKKCLLERTAARTSFTVLGGEKFDSELKELKLNPQMLFQNGGKMKGGKFPHPDAEAVRKLCAVINADAIILGTMDEPRRTNGQYFLDPGGLNYDSAHVETKAGLFLMKADGTEILHDYIETLHPLTKRRDRDFVLIDWKESTELMIEDFLDEVCRYSPSK